MQSEFSVLLITFFLLFISLKASSQAITWAKEKEFIEIGDKLSILEDKEQNLNFEKVSGEDFQDKFKTSNQLNLSLGYSESIFWLKFSLNNNIEENLVLVLAQAGLPQTNLYYKDDSGNIIKLEAGYRIPLSQKIIRSSFQAFPLPKGNREYYVQLSTNSEPIPVRIFKSNAFEERSNNQKLIYGFYLGLLFFVMLSNLFFYFSLSNRLYLFYSLIVLLYASYAAAVIDGFIVYFFDRIDLIFWYTTIPPIGVTIQTVYCLYFLEVKKYAPKLFKIVLGIVFYFAIWAGIKFFFSFPIVQPINTLNALISFFLMGYIGIKVGKKGNKLGFYFALAYFIYFVLVLVQAIYINTGFPPYLAELSHVAYATLIEAFVLSFLLSKRFEWEKEEISKSRTESQQYALEKTQENEKIVREQNQMLEEQVTARTLQLNESMKIAEAERQKSDALLLNILPAEIAEELRQTGTSTAHNYEMATVLFADIKDFTKISTKFSAETMIKELGYIFGAFDKIIERHNIEKIKIIGDAYMCAGGLPISNSTNATDVVNAAIEIQDFMKKMRAERAKESKQEYEIRIGINTGPLVAGIIGIKKFTYDIWGDTVNLASRLEASGEVNKINISENTYQLIKDRFDCEYRGKIEVKGKGSTSMYFVHGVKNHITNFELIEKRILKMLKHGLNPTLHYHGFPHTIEVIKNVIMIAEKEGITEEDIHLLKMAALFHDLGFLEAYSGHEAVGCRMAKEYLPAYSVSEEDIEEICGMIMSTKIPQSPKTLLEKILCDADLLYLGTDDFIVTGNTLFQELVENNKLSTEREWNELQLSFLKKHHFQTDYCKNNFTKKKNENLKLIKDWLNSN
ncbi:MAG: adenylate/guanylate cyclase domain-containing protein [Bacteroidota bacterium]